MSTPVAGLAAAAGAALALTLAALTAPAPAAPVDPYAQYRAEQRAYDLQVARAQGDALAASVAAQLSH